MWRYHAPAPSFAAKAEELEAVFRRINTKKSANFSRVIHILLLLFIWRIRLRDTIMISCFHEQSCSRLCMFVREHGAMHRPMVGVWRKAERKIATLDATCRKEHWIVHWKLNSRLCDSESADNCYSFSVNVYQRHRTRLDISLPKDKNISSRNACCTNSIFLLDPSLLLREVLIRPSYSRCLFLRTLFIKKKRWGRKKIRTRNLPWLLGLGLLVERKNV